VKLSSRVSADEAFILMDKIAALPNVKPVGWISYAEEMIR